MESLCEGEVTLIQLRAHPPSCCIFVVGRKLVKSWLWSEADILSAEVPDSMIRNALLLLCASRRFGCTLFLLPSDIALCRPDAVFLLIGTLMASTR